MIKYTYKDGLTIPVIVCDVCGERITDGAMAAAVSGELGISHEVDSLFDVIFVHKGKCHTRAENKVRSEKKGIDTDTHIVGWTELRTFLSYLVHNTGFKLEDLKDDDGTD